MAIRKVEIAAGRGRSLAIQSILTDYKTFVDVANRETRRIMLGAAKIGLRHTLPLVPTLTGALKESGRAKVVKNEKGYAGIVSFGGPDAKVKPTKSAPTGIVDYAQYVNYDLEASHDNGEAMFLEKGFKLAKTEIDNFVVKELKKVDGKSGRGSRVR